MRWSLILTIFLKTFCNVVVVVFVSCAPQNSVSRGWGVKVFPRTAWLLSKRTYLVLRVYIEALRDVQTLTQHICKFLYFKAGSIDSTNSYQSMTHLHIFGKFSLSNSCPFPLSLELFFASLYT